MVQRQRGKEKKRSRKGEASRVMVDWVAVWQAAKKGLSHSPYVTCFPSASAVRIRYQSAPADGLGVLNCSHLTMSPFLLPLPVTLFFLPPQLPLSCLCHMSHGCDRWREKADACWKHGRPTHTRTQTKLPPTHVSVALLRFHTAMLQSVCEGRRWEEYCFRASDRPWQRCIELHILSFSLINMQLPGGEQMAEPSTPPAGCCRHATGISVGTTAGPGSPLGPGFYPTLT